MTRTEYDMEMNWAELWIDIWGILQDLDIYHDLDHKWFAWIVSQTGFAYMEYPYNPGIAESTFILLLVYLGEYHGLLGKMYTGIV